MVGVITGHANATKDSLEMEPTAKMSTNVTIIRAMSMPPATMLLDTSYVRAPKASVEMALTAHHSVTLVVG
jgi:hypothetical protein